MPMRSRRSRWSARVPAEWRRRLRSFPISATSPAACARAFGRPTGRLTVSKKAPMQRHEGGYDIRLLAVDKPGPRPPSPSDLHSRTSRSNRSSSVTAASDPMGETRPGPFERTGTGNPDHLCDHRRRRAQGAGRGRSRQGGLGETAGHSDREKLIELGLAVIAGGRGTTT